MITITYLTESGREGKMSVRYHAKPSNGRERKVNALYGKALKALKNCTILSTVIDTEPKD